MRPPMTRSGGSTWITRRRWPPSGTGPDPPPRFIVIDTVGMTTARNLCRPEETRAYCGPLADLATATGIPVLALTHLSKDKEALGDGSSARPESSGI